MIDANSDESEVILDLMQTLEKHLANGFDGHGQFLTDRRRDAMASLIAELRERLVEVQADAAEQPSNQVN